MNQPEHDALMEYLEYMADEERQNSYAILIDQFNEDIPF